MKPIRAYEIANAVGGKLISGDDIIVTSVCQDSRLAKKDSIFVAINGDAFDGHDFIGSAIEKGSCVVIADNEEKAKEYAGKATIIKVANSEKALQKLASRYIKSLHIKKAAVTGSTGKTSTRDMLYYVLAEKFNTGKNEGNFNSTVGVPLTVMTFDDKTEAAVIEMGMDTPGEIEIMTRIVEPDIALITNIGVAHLERLGSRDAIFDAKMEITTTFGKDNTLIVAEDKEYLNREKIKGDFKLILVGESDNCDFKIEDIKTDSEGKASFTISHNEERESFSLPVPGRHNAFNAGLAVAAGKLFGVTMKEAAKGLSKMELTGKRLSVKSSGDIKVIDDTYNASPDSMRAALNILGDMEGKRKIAVLGDMYELGKDEAEFHRQIGDLAKEKTDRFYSIGGLAKHMDADAHFDTVEDFLKKADDIFKDGDVVLVKASRKMALERVVEKILS